MSTAHIERIYQENGVHAAFEEACLTVRRQSSEMDDLWNSRFFERRILENGAKKLWPTTEARISNALDMSDCNDEPLPEFLYCDEDGELYPVTLGKNEPINEDQEQPVFFAAADMLANGKVVGSVLYSDH